jgi:2-polyprenyl-3-methyl-5-hydroxy-6-metoxy-1,4-benzoquinol methylase
MKETNSYIDWKNWNEGSFGFTSKFEKVYFDNILKLLKLDQHARILEIGFGNGSFLGHVNRCNFKCDGVESNETLVDIALENNFSAFSSISLIDNKNKYDLIILFDVIEHIHADNVEFFLKQLGSYIKNTGLIFLRFPNGSSPLGLGNQHGDPTHCNIVTLPKLNYWCSTSNLQIIQYRGDIRPFIFKHNLLKAPSRIIKLFLYNLTEKFIRLISNQSKGILASNLEVVIQKSNES